MPSFLIIAKWQNQRGFASNNEKVGLNLAHNDGTGVNLATLAMTSYAVLLVITNDTLQISQ